MTQRATAASATSASVAISADGAALTGELTIPAGARAIVVFAHGSGSSRLSPRNRFVATQLNRADLATLLVDLLTPAEEEIDARDRSLRLISRSLPAA